MGTICNTCNGTGTVDGLHNWGNGGKRSEKCWNCHPDTASKPESVDAAIRTLQGMGYTYHDGEQWKPPIGSPIQSNVDSMKAQLDEADRRAGAAERELAQYKEDVQRLERVRDEMKQQWGVDRNTSFDAVWDEACALKKQALLKKGRDAVLRPKPIVASVVKDGGGEKPAYCLMVAYRNEQDAHDVLTELTGEKWVVKPEPDIPEVVLEAVKNAGLRLIKNADGHPALVPDFVSSTQEGVK